MDWRLQLIIANPAPNETDSYLILKRQMIMTNSILLRKAKWGVKKGIGNILIVKFGTRRLYAQEKARTLQPLVFKRQLPDIEGIGTPVAFLNGKCPKTNQRRNR
jgi:hypothetical protein